jgi:hypothetical protein
MVTKQSGQAQLQEMHQQGQSPASELHLPDKAAGKTKPNGSLNRTLFQSHSRRVTVS